MKPVVGHYQSTFFKLTEHWIATQIDAVERHDIILLSKRRRNHSLSAERRWFTLEQLDVVRRQYNRAAWRLRGYAPYFRDVCQRERVRAIHAWFGYSGDAMRPLARRLEVPLITSFLGADFTRGDVEQLRRGYRKLFLEGDAFVAEGPAAASRLVDLGCPQDKLHIARIAIDVAAIPFATRTLARGAPLRVLMAARFTEKKGLPVGVEAFCRFIENGGRGRLTIVGDADDRPGRIIAERLRRIVAHYRCAEAVEFVGWRKPAELRGMFADHHVFLHPSITAADGDAEGGHPVIMTEVAASGMPIIGTFHCDIPEIVQDGQTGWLVAEGDVAATASALHDAATSPDKLHTFGLQARSMVAQKYDITTRGLDALYEALGI